MDRNNYSLRQRISETLNEKCYISCDCKYSCTVTIFFIQFMGNTSVVFRKSLCSVKKQFILILELPCKIVQSSKYLIMAKKNKDRYLNIFFSFMMNKMPSFVFLGYLGHETLASDTFPMGVVLLEMS